VINKGKVTPRRGISIPVERTHRGFVYGETGRSAKKKLRKGTPVLSREVFAWGFATKGGFSYYGRLLLAFRGVPPKTPPKKWRPIGPLPGPTVVSPYVKK